MGGLWPPCRRRVLPASPGLRLLSGQPWWAAEPLEESWLADSCGPEPLSAPWGRAGALAGSQDKTGNPDGVSYQLEGSPLF